LSMFRRIRERHNLGGSAAYGPIEDRAPNSKLKRESTNAAQLCNVMLITYSWARFGQA